MTHCTEESLYWVIKRIALDESNTGALELFAERGLVFKKRSDSMGDSLLDDKKAEIAKKQPLHNVARC